MPDTINFMLLGYAAVLVILGGVTAYLLLKRRQLNAERHELEALIRDNTPDQGSA